MTSPTPRKLTRSTADKRLAGVAGGLGRYFSVDPVLFRVGFVVATLLSGAGLVAYLGLMLVLPTDAEDAGDAPGDPQPAAA